MKKLTRGQSLFEVLFAIVIAGAILVAIVSATTKNVSNSTGSQSRSQATNLAQEAVEWLRGQRDTDFDTFSSYAGVGTTPITYCAQTLGEDMTSLVPGACLSNSAVETEFVRQIALLKATATATQVTATVTVTWTDSSGTHESRSVVTFTDWRAR